MSHFITYYDCGKHVLAQCRCPAALAKKVFTITKHPCPECPRPDYSEPPPADPKPLCRATASASAGICRVDPQSRSQLK